MDKRHTGLTQPKVEVLCYQPFLDQYNSMQKYKYPLILSRNINEQENCYLTAWEANLAITKHFVYLHAQILTRGHI